MMEMNYVAWMIAIVVGAIVLFIGYNIYKFAKGEEGERK